MDNINGMLVFTRVADSGSFAAAGQQLGVSASAVGKAIARLEARFGVQLFRRTTRSLKLTPEGQQFLTRCRRILSEVEAAEQELKDATGQPRGLLRVSLPMLGEAFVPALAAFQAAYPSVQLDAEFSDRKADLVTEGFDAVLRTGALEDNRLTARRLGGFRMVLVASPAYLAAFDTPRMAADLAAHRCIVFRMPESGKLQPWLLDEGAGPSPFHPLPTTICNSLQARLGYALAGEGIAYLPDFLVRTAVASGTLRLLLDQAATYKNSLHLVWRSGRHQPPKLRAFIDHMADAVRLNA